MSDQPFKRPFPALTPAQRYSLDMLGYVIVPNTLTPDEVGRTREALQRLKRDIIANKGTQSNPVRGSWFQVEQPNHHYLVSIIEADPSITDYVCHPRLVGMAEELMGSEARITEVNAHINSRDPKAELSKEPKFGFHRGTDVPFGSHTVNGLYHCNFV